MHDMRVRLAARKPAPSLRRMVEAAGVEPASESIPPKHLHAYPGF